LAITLLPDRCADLSAIFSHGVEIGHEVDERRLDAEDAGLLVDLGRA
jgi:hypothetical protein